MTGRAAGRWTPLAALVAAGLLVTGCAGLPTTSAVNPGLAVGEELAPPDFSFEPDRPQPGASPQQIVEGFIAAGSGPRDRWAVAREYLTPRFGDQWNPDAGVTIVAPGPRTDSDAADAAVSISVTAEATVDATGAYAIPEAGQIELRFALEMQEDGEWRISEAPDGVVLEQDVFDIIFRPARLAFFDPTFAYLVPDLRWFPRENIATRVAGALVDGAPSPWLAESVVSAIPESVELARQAVPLSGTTAQVELEAAALSLEPLTLQRMQTQLDETMASVGVADVQMSVGGTPLTAEPVGVRSTRVNTLPLVLTADGLGFLSGDTLEPVAGLSPTVETLDPAPIGLELSAERDAAAVRLADGVVARVQADGAFTGLDTRSGLIDPTLDAAGWTWSVPAAEPAALAAFAPSGERVDIAGAWPGATEIAAMQLSRDGTRLAAVAFVGGRWVVVIAGVVRTADGVPERLSGDVSELAVLPGRGLDVGWLDDATLGAVVRVGDEAALVIQPVGGDGSAEPAPARTTSLAGSNQVTGVRLRTDEGGMFVRRGTNWLQAAEQVAVLGTQQGQPE